jgi:hypothetical protein
MSRIAHNVFVGDAADRKVLMDAGLVEASMATRQFGCFVRQPPGLIIDFHGVERLDWFTYLI